MDKFKKIALFFLDDNLLQKIKDSFIFAPLQNLWNKHYETALRTQGKLRSGAVLDRGNF